MNKLMVLSARLIALGMMAGTACGANAFWDNGGTDNLWSNPTNWTTDTLPVSGAIIYLRNEAPDAPQTIVLDTNVTVGYLRCEAAGLRTYTINSINGAAITNFTSTSLNIWSSATFSNNVTLNCDIADTKAYIQADRNTINTVFALNGQCNVPGYLFAGGTLSLATKATIAGYLNPDTSQMNLRLKDSGTGDVTLRPPCSNWTGLEKPATRWPSPTRLQVLRWAAR